jgi:hypothetical protein
MASSCGSTPEMAKKQVCSTVLVRRPMPLAWATAVASITKSRSCFAMMSRCQSRGSFFHVRLGADAGELRSTVAPGAAYFSTSARPTKLNWLQATKSAVPDQVGRANGPRAEPQVRCGDRAGLLRVVDEVALREVLGLLADDLDRVLVRADGAVGPETDENAAADFRRLKVEIRLERRAMCR